MSSDDSTLEENKRIARRIPEQIASEGAIGLVDDLFAQDVGARAGPLGDAAGRDAFRELPQRMRGAFPDLEATVEELVAEGNRVAMRVTLAGTHEGHFMGVEPTEETFEVEHAIFLRIEDGKIVELWGQLDTFALLRQLGQLDGPAEQS
jgi:steroid delta-isomerase-like uncharacterized protein